VAVLAWLYQLCAQAADPTVAVLGFGNRSDFGRFGALGDSLARLLQVDLASMPGLRVVERREVDRALDELQLGETGLLDPATVAKLGSAIPANLHVYGAIDAEIATSRPLTEASITVVAHVRHLQTGRVVATTKAQAAAGELPDVKRRLAKAVLRAVRKDAIGHSASDTHRARDAEVAQLLKRVGTLRGQRSNGEQEKLLTAAYFLNPHDPRVLYQLALSRYAGEVWLDGYQRYYHRKPTDKAALTHYTDSEAIGWLREVVEEHIASEWFDDALWEIVHYAGCPVALDEAWRLMLTHAPKSERIAELGLYLMCCNRALTPLDEQIAACLTRLVTRRQAEAYSLRPFTGAERMPLFKPIARAVSKQAQIIMWHKALNGLTAKGRYHEAVEKILKWTEDHPGDQWRSEKYARAARFCQVQLHDSRRAMGLYARAIDVVGEYRLETEELRQGLHRFWKSTLEAYRHSRVRYALGLVKCCGTDWEQRAQWADRAIAFWQEDARDFGYKPPAFERRPVRLEAAHARYMLGDYQAAYAHYEALSELTDVEHHFRRKTTARRQFLDCARRLNRVPAANAILAKWETSDQGLKHPSPYRRCAFGLRDTQAVVEWQGQLYCFVRRAGMPNRQNPRERHPVAMSTFRPDTEIATIWPIKAVRITAPVTAAATIYGQVWLATYGQGLFVRDLVTGAWRHITTANGLLDDRVCTLATDERERVIWCAFPKGAASHDLLEGEWSAYTHRYLERVPQIYPSDDSVRFATWWGTLILNRKTGQFSFHKTGSIARQLLLRHRGFTYWLRDGRYVHRTNAKGERDGPELEVEDLTLAVRPLVVGDMLVVGARREVFGVDFARGRVVPILAGCLTYSYKGDWGYPVSMAALGTTLYVGTDRGFFWRDVGGGGSQSPSNAIGLLAFDTTWPDTVEPKALTELLRQLAE